MTTNDAEVDELEERYPRKLWGKARKEVITKTPRRWRKRDSVCLSVIDSGRTSGEAEGEEVRRLDAGWQEVVGLLAVMDVDTGGSRR